MAYQDNISRLSRLTAILLKLQTRPFVQVQQLAEQFEVSKRTIYRDIASLEQSGVPILSEEGKGYTLMDGYHMPPVTFTESEANALILAEKLISKTKDESLIREFNKATDKIKSVLGDSDKAKASFLSERIIIGKNWDEQTTSTYLSEIQASLTNYTALQISYQKANDSQPSIRTIEPFAIYHNTLEQWVVIAWCRWRKDFRSFRLDRIQRLEVLSETFAPHEISLEEYVKMQEEKFSKGP